MLEHIVPNIQHVSNKRSFALYKKQTIYTKQTWSTITIFGNVWQVIAIQIKLIIDI